MAAVDDTGFLSRWSRRKVALRQGMAPPEPAPEQPLAKTPAPEAPAVAVFVGPAGAATPAANVPAEATPAANAVGEAPPRASPVEPAPTLVEAAALTPASDFRRFVAPGVDSQVKNAALKKLFTDPHFNVMDGLDTYIDDYGKPDPLPLSMLRQMVQGKFLGLFSEEEATAAQATAAGDAADAAADAADAAGADAAAEAAANAADVQDAACDACDDASRAVPEAPPTTAAPPAVALLEPSTPPDEDTDLRLQSHHGAGRQSAEPGAGQDAGRQR